MKGQIRLLGVLAAVAAGAFMSTVPAQAGGEEDGPPGHGVFVQTNDPGANSIAAFHRNSDGTLTYTTSYATGGKGGREAGSGSDPLASQGSLQLVSEERLLLAVNAGSNTISALQVSGDRLRLIQVIASGGQFPSGLAVHNDLLYVLNAGGEGAVSGFRIEDGSLHPIAGSTRSLQLGNDPNPAFLKSPAQVGFTPRGDHLIVTTKTHNTVDVFSVDEDGRLSAAPVKNQESGVPFAFVFDHAGRMVLNFAGNSSLQTFKVNADNTITPVEPFVVDGQAALCWVTPARGYEYASNTGSGSVSQFKVAGDGTVTLVNATAATGIDGAIDSAVGGGRFLYVQSGINTGANGSVHAFSIGIGGSLTLIQIANVPGGASQEGIVAN